MNLNDPNTRRKFTTAIKAGVAVIACAIIAPAVYLAIKGLVGATVAIALGIVILQFAPVFADKVANLRMKATMHEAKTNPIETLKNQIIKRQQELESQRAAIEEYDARVSTFAGEVERVRKEYPADTAKYDALLENMRDILERRSAAYKSAEAALREFIAQVKKQESLWELAKVAQATKQGAPTGNDVIEDLKADAAFRSVELELNRSMASLRTELLTTEEPHTIDMPLPQIKEKRNAL
ncbi:hypothetical protein WT27_13035 [Burkholderia territorii]|uniref:Uncharacterized protein n=1 Tax=Burkholderia territorii TaxID=1503055 RepID=A0A106DR24_9BURK|nr:hypothetical protein [Burkholderia territorii]KVV40846.1 hypothetical protein WT27_13035 [Burkholderia territorii]KVX33793.1 hypothetical protein WT31_08935 [Burkholderia territorii]